MKTYLLKETQLVPSTQSILTRNIFFHLSRCTVRPAYERHWNIKCKLKIDILLQVLFIILIMLAKELVMIIFHLLYGHS